MLLNHPPHKHAVLRVGMARHRMDCRQVATDLVDKTSSLQSTFKWCRAIWTRQGAYWRQAVVKRHSH